MSRLLVGRIGILYDTALICRDNRNGILSHSRIATALKQPERDIPRSRVQFLLAELAELLDLDALTEQICRGGPSRLTEQAAVRLDRLIPLLDELLRLAGAQGDGTGDQSS